MKRMILVASMLISLVSLKAQIEVVKILGKNSSDYSIGFGAALKFSFPVSDAGYGTVEGGAVFAQIKGTGYSEGIALVPIKLGYRHTLDGSGTGFYVEPQAGYCVTGALTNDFVDQTIKGFDWAAGIGYLFRPSGRIQFDIGLRYETVYSKGGHISFMGLRISHNFSFGNRQSD